MGAKKIKPIKKVQKPTLPQETGFEKVRMWADKNYALVISAGAVILFTIILVWGYSAHDRSKETSARSDYGLLVSRLPAEAKGNSADWEKLIPDLEKFISEHKDTAPALDAKIELSKAFFETKRYAEAAKTGEEALRLAPTGLKPLVMYQLGYAYEADGKADEAARVWTNLKQLGVTEFEREANFNLAKILESKKELDKAAEMYQLASEAPGDYPSASLIDQGMARVKAGP